MYYIYVYEILFTFMQLLKKLMTKQKDEKKNTKRNDFLHLQVIII